jgi:phosphate transport system protein
MQAHTLKSFDVALNDLSARINLMYKLVRKNVRQCQKAFKDHDVELVESILQREAMLNDLEVAIDEAARQLIVHHQPAASDLRFVFAATKIVTDLERMGDLTINVAKTIQRLNASEGDVPMVFGTLSELVIEQIKLARRAFLNRDPQLAAQAIEHDDLIDAQFANDQRALLTYMAENPALISHCMQLSTCLKQLERVGDHAVNTAEMVVYMVVGREARHISQDELLALVGEDEDEE